MEPGGMMTDKKRKQSSLQKTCPSVILCTINNTWTALGSNPALCGEKRVTDYLSYGMAVKGRMTDSVTSVYLHVTIL
jgi:hypothetical protein